jgi:Kef-type K+ transport system membrane component KefB
MKRNSLIYLFILTLICVPIIGILHHGSTLPAPGGVAPSAVVTGAARTVSATAVLISGIQENLGSPLSNLFLQLVVIIACSRLVGRIFTAFGQPAVVGEMAAGILLGPSLFGLIAPGAFAFVFPTTSFGTLRLLSQIGVCLFMFTVGMELNVSHVRHRAQAAVVVSHASIIFPYLLGVGAAYFLYTQMAAPGASFLAFGLFMGISMSITAFPVLARILQERGLSKTALGSTAITCAAVDDVTAWSILAFVVAVTRAGNVAGSALNLLLVLAFVATMVWGVKPLLPRLVGSSQLSQDDPPKGALATIVCVLLIAALATEIIGIHALFGAFLAGAIMPETNQFRQKLSVRIENFSTVLLLPLFFVFTGLRTQISLLNDVQGWLICGGVVVIATVGKLGGTAITARLTGMNWSESLQLGALMNTRGLMELIALNIGYDLGVLSPKIFTILVVMALATTMLTGPLLTLFTRQSEAPDTLPAPAHS